MSIISDETAAKYIMTVLSQCSTAEAKFILNSRSRANYQRTALHGACIQGYKLTVTLLLESNLLDINATDYQDATPLHLACFYQQFEVVEILIAHGAKIHKNLETFLSPLVEELSMLGAQIYDELMSKIEDGDFNHNDHGDGIIATGGTNRADSTERYNLSQKYTTCKNSYAQLSGRIITQTVDEGNIASLYFSTTIRTVGSNRPTMTRREFETLIFLEIM